MNDNVAERGFNEVVLTRPPITNSFERHIMQMSTLGTGCVQRNIVVTDTRSPLAGFGRTAEITTVAGLRNVVLACGSSLVEQIEQLLAGLRP